MSLVDLCKEGDLEGVKAALQSGADVNTEDEFGEIGLMGAVIYNHNSVVALLLNTPNIDVNQMVGGFGWSALHWAVQEKNNEAVKLLLNVPNIDVNIVDYSGDSAVHHAVSGNNIEALKLLLNVPNIDVNIVDNDGYSAVHAAVKKTTRNVTRCKEEGIEGLKLLFSHPSLTALTLNMKDKYGETPLMLAMRRMKGYWMGEWHVAVEVLAADPRVDLDTTDNEGLSPTYWEHEILYEW